jgi:broad specificity phosphatase PhoE
LSEILVVRHAQATFASADYDRLSELGHRQAALLGEWLAAHDTPFAAVACGGMRRHRETLAAIEHALAQAGHPVVEARCIRGLDEFDHRDVLAVYTRRNPDDPVVRAANGAPKDDVRAIYHFLRAALRSWARGELDDAVSEPWPVFKRRVEAAAGELVAIAREHERLLVVTSGGIMARLAAAALDVPDERAIDLNLSIRNSAISEFRAIDGALRLSSWNALPHLAAPERRAMWTSF